MPTRQQLESIVNGAGLTIAFDPPSTTPVLFGHLTGESIGQANAWLKADDEVCNVSMYVGTCSTDASSCALGFELLKLNLRHAYGRISIAEARMTPEDTPRFFVICETMISLANDAEHSIEELKSRLRSLTALQSAAEILVDQYS